MRWLAFAFLGFVIELWLLVGLGRWLGGELVFTWVLGTLVVGAILAKREGLRVLSSFRQALSEMRAPPRGVTEELLLFVGAALLVLPGVVGDLVGALLLLLPVRRALAERLEPRLLRFVDIRVPGFPSSVRTPSQRAPRSNTPPRQRAPRGRVTPIDVEGELIEER